MKTGYTIARKSDYGRGTYDLMSDDKGEVIVFPTPDEAFQYWMRKHYWDTTDIELFQVHDFKLTFI